MGSETPARAHPTASVAAAFLCPDCQAPLPDRCLAGYCAACHHAWVRCDACDTPVSPLWRFCPIDGSRVRTSSLADANGPLRFASRDPKRTLLDKDVKQPPVAHGGYLWAISTSTNLLRLAPLDAAPTPVKHERPEYGKGPFDIVRDTASQRPLVVAVGTRRIAVADPAAPGQGGFSAHSETLPSPCDYRDEHGRLSRNHYFVPTAAERNGLPTSDGYPAIAFSDGTIAVLKRKNTTEALALWHRGKELTSYDLPERDVTGPLQLSGRLCLYSSTRFYWLDGDALQGQDFPQSFRTLNKREYAKVHVPWGRVPFVVGGTVAYLPGTVGGQPGFVSVEWTGAKPTLRHIAVQGGEAYSVRSDDRLLLAGNGRVQFASRSSLLHSVLETPSIRPGPVLLHGDEVIVTCSNGPGLELRVYGDGSERLSVPQGCLPVDLFLFPGFLVLTAIAGERDQVEVLSWQLA